ncbi:MAG: M28 family peptidase [Acidobacteriota bacterium]|nr:M28 family peptidase [Acidobacteriota bacterium]
MSRFSAQVLPAALLAARALCAQEVPPATQAALDRITADALRGDLSFLASDALEGRGTPSRGLDIAAEFIASQFRRAGLEPAAAGQSYFQWAKFAEVTPKLDDFRLTLKADGEALELTSVDVRVHSASALELSNQPVIVLPPGGAFLKGMPDIAGRIIAGDERRDGSEAHLNLLQARHPALIVLVSGRGAPQEQTFLEDVESGHAPVLHIVNEEAVAALMEGRHLALSVHLSAPARKDAALRNVAGILRGSDPVLRDQYVIVSAHYDHLGLSTRTPGDSVFNGADDNGSGTVSVIELANALASLRIHPRRSILFLTVFGEEEGLLGSYFYAEHPLVPIKDTVADINLEMMGRTDDPAGAEVGAMGITGMAFSDLPATISAAAKTEGVRVFTRHDEAQLFSRSDNYAFALAGVVAHTVAVAFDFPDYHSPGDEWQKIDYPNMAMVDRAVGAGILDIANAPSPPKWSNSKEAGPYREAGK